VGESPLFLLMREILSKTEESVEDVIRGLDVFKKEYELIGVKLFQQGRNLYLKILVNKIGGISIDECAKLNKIIGEDLDREDVIRDSYILEVSSPGIDYPIRNESEFRCLVGRKLKVRYKDGRVIIAILKDVKKGKIFLESKEGMVKISIEKIDFAIQELEKS
jgi:ribosome maturation factor RimP